MINGNSGVRIPQRQADPWETLANAHFDHDAAAAVSAWKSVRIRFRARYLFAWDTSVLMLGAERELSAATRAQLAEIAGEAAR